MRRSWLFSFALLGLALLLPLAFLPDSYVVRVLILVLLFAAMGQAWNLPAGLANQVSLGHGAFFGIGAYTSTILLLDYGLSPWLGMLLGGFVAALVALLISLPTLRLRGHYFALATLAFGQVALIVASSWKSLTGGQVGLSVPFLSGNSISMLQFQNAYYYYYITLAALVIVTIIFWRIRTGRTGYLLRALKEDQDAAEVVGVNTTQIKMRIMVLSGFITAMLGSLFAQFNYFIDPASVFGLVSISVFMALVCIVGGLGTVWGPIVGAALLVPLEEISSILLGGSQAGLSQLFYGVLLIVIILLSPRGLVPLAQGAAARFGSQRSSKLTQEEGSGK